MNRRMLRDEGVRPRPGTPFCLHGHIAWLTTDLYGRDATCWSVLECLKCLVNGAWSSAVSAYRVM